MEEAHEATLQVAKGLALVGFRVINDEKFFYKVSFITILSTPTNLTLVQLQCDPISVQVKDSFHPNK